MGSLAATTLPRRSAWASPVLGRVGLMHLQIGAQRTQRHFCGCPAPKVSPGFNPEQISDKRKSRDFLQSNWPILFESIKVIQNRNAEELPQVKRDEGGVTVQCDMWS